MNYRDIRGGGDLGMSEWDFLWGLTGDTLMDAMATGGTEEDWAYIVEQERQQRTKNNMRIRKLRRKTSASVMKKKNTVLLIDGENISCKKADAILKAALTQGMFCESKVYGRQKDTCMKGWYEKAKEYGIHDIRLYGGPMKDKIDKKLQNDARKEVACNKNVDIVCLATSDGGYVDIITELRSQGKRVVIIGEKKAPETLHVRP